jgi:hypothetical protein
MTGVLLARASTLCKMRRADFAGFLKQSLLT